MSGMNDLLLEEDWAHRKNTIRYLAELLDAGQGVSGPKASLAIAATQALPRHLTAGDERRMRLDKSLVLYDNPSAIALCMYREQHAVCQKLSHGNQVPRPDLLNCVDGCICAVRTDENLIELRNVVEQLRKQARLSPKPLAQSLLAEADEKEAIAERFEQNRLTLMPTPKIRPLE